MWREPFAFNSYLTPSFDIEWMIRSSTLSSEEMSSLTKDFPLLKYRSPVEKRVIPSDQAAVILIYSSLGKVVTLLGLEEEVLTEGKRRIISQVGETTHSHTAAIMTCLTFALPSPIQCSDY